MTENIIEIYTILISDNFETEKYQDILPLDERQRLLSFKNEKARFQFGFSRMVLRFLLSDIIKIKPNEISIAYNEFGKPYVSKTLFPGCPFFNISHAGNYLVIAISLNNDIGVDIEKINHDKSLLDAASIYFHKKEILRINSERNNLKFDLFYKYWTIKESFVKAIGIGLSYPLSEFYVEILDDNTSNVHSDYDLNLSKNWQSGFVAAPKGYFLAFTTHATIKPVIRQKIVMDLPDLFFQIKPNS